MGQHSPIPPDDCASCQRVFARLKEHYEAGGGRLLAAVLGREVGLKERALRVHLAYLAVHCRIEADRRTPVPGATVAPAAPALPEGAWPTPLDWAVTVECPDRTCRRLFLLLAREANVAWEGQVSLETAAEALGVSVRTAQTHRAHLVSAGLLRVWPVADVLPSGLPQRRPDGYQLLSQERSVPSVPSGASWDEDRAIEVLDRIPWWPGAAPGETSKAVRRIIRHFRNGWTVDALVKRLAFEPRQAVISRISLLRKMLPPLDQPYVVPALDQVGGGSSGAAGRAWSTCGECGRPFAHDARARDGQLCRDCSPRTALAGVPIVRGTGDPAF